MRLEELRNSELDDKKTFWYHKRGLEGSLIHKRTKMIRYVLISEKIKNPISGGQHLSLFDAEKAEDDHPCTTKRDTSFNRV